MMNHVAKSQPLDVYRSQRRGGKGKTATTTKDEDFVDKLFVANTHDTLLCFSNQGRLYWLKVYQVPQAGRTARGRPLVNLLALIAMVYCNLRTSMAAPVVAPVPSTLKVETICILDPAQK